MGILTGGLRLLSEAVDEAAHAPAPHEADGLAPHAAPGLHASEDEHGHHATPHKALIFMFFSLWLGAVVRTILLRVKGLPYTVILILLGILIGIIEFQLGFGEMGSSIRSWASIDPHLLLYVFLPALIFESAFSFDWHTFKNSFAQVLWLAGPGVLINVAITTPILKFVLPYDWSWTFSMMFASILSATDPVAVVALLKELGASKKLGTIVEGESLLNDGVAIVLFTLFFEMAAGDDKTAADVTVFFLKVPLGAAAIGILFFLGSLWWLERVYHDALVEISITVVGCYLAFYVSEELCGVSGVLAVVVLGVLLSGYGKAYFAGEVEHSLHHFWSMVSYAANTLIFLLAGLIIAESLYLDDDSRGNGKHIRGEDVGWALFLYLVINVVRGLTVAILFPILARTGYGLDIPNAIMLTWGGLRGAVGLALALIVNGEQEFGDEGHRVLFLTGMMVVLTLLVNGSTSAFVLSALQLNKQSLRKDDVFRSVMKELKEASMQQYLNNFRDDRLGAADYDTVKAYVDLLGHAGHEEDEGAEKTAEEETETMDSMMSVNSDGKAVEKRSFRNLNVSQYMKHRKRRSSELGKDAIHKELLRDARTRLLESVKVYYWEMLEHGSLYKRVHFLVNGAADNALDRASEPLSEWTGLRQQITSGIDVPFFYGLINLGALLRAMGEKVYRRYLNSVLESSVLATDAFIQAHESAEHELETTLSQSNPSLIERKQTAEAREYLKEVRLSHAEVLLAVKSKTVARHLLTVQREYVQKVAKTGLLEEKEAEELMHQVDRNIKYLVAHPPKVSLLSSQDILYSTPIFKHMPPILKRTIGAYLCGEDGERHISKQAGETIFLTGADAHDIYLIGRGVVEIATTDGNVTTMGSRSHQYGWAHGSYSLLCEAVYSRKDRGLEEAPSNKTDCKRLYTCKAGSPLVMWKLTPDLLHLIVDQGGNAVRDEFWKNALSTLYETGILRGPIGDHVPGVLGLIIDGSLMEVRSKGGEPGTIEIPEGEMAVLAYGSVFSEQLGSLEAPMVLHTSLLTHDLAHLAHFGLVSGGGHHVRPGGKAQSKGSGKMSSVFTVEGDGPALILKRSTEETTHRPMLGVGYEGSSFTLGASPGPGGRTLSVTMQRSSSRKIQAQMSKQMSLGRDTMTMPSSGPMHDQMAAFAMAHRAGAPQGHQMGEMTLPAGAGMGNGHDGMPSRHQSARARLPSFSEDNQVAGAPPQEVMARLLADAKGAGAGGRSPGHMPRIADEPGLEGSRHGTTNGAAAAALNGTPPESPHVAALHTGHGTMMPPFAGELPPSDPSTPANSNHGSNLGRPAPESPHVTALRMGHGGAMLPPFAGELPPSDPNTPVHTSSEPSDRNRGSPAPESPHVTALHTGHGTMMPPFASELPPSDPNTPVHPSSEPSDRNRGSPAPESPHVAALHTGHGTMMPPFAGELPPSDPSTPANSNHGSNLGRPAPESPHVTALRMGHGGPMLPPFAGELPPSDPNTPASSNRGSNPPSPHLLIHNLHPRQESVVPSPQGHPISAHATVSVGSASPASSTPAAAVAVTAAGGGERQDGAGGEGRERSDVDEGGVHVEIDDFEAACREAGVEH